jgi:acetyl esterase/lipase
MLPHLRRTGTPIRLATLCLIPLAAACGGAAAERPWIAEDISPLEPIAPVAEDGHVGAGYLRKPPGNGPFPAVVFIHGGAIQRPPGGLRTHILGPGVSRFLEAGYAVASITYRSRENPLTETELSLADVVAAIDLIRSRPYVDAGSVVINGCSGGGDLALRLAGLDDFPAVIVEEPATILMTHLVTAEVLAQYARGEVVDPVGMYENAGGSDVFRDRIARIESPILFIEGDLQNPNNTFNSEIFLAEMRAAGKALEVSTYAGDHCFAFDGAAESAQVAFEDTDGYIKARIATQAQAVDPSLVEYIPSDRPLEREPVDIAREALVDYVGDYRLPMGLAGLPAGINPTMSVALEGGQLTVEVREGSLGTIPLLAESETFFFSEQGFTMEFVRDDAGRVVGQFWEGLWVPRIERAEPFETN